MKSNNDMLTEDFFRDRLRFLRNERKLSAREMSLSLGQNESYINKIETGRTSTSITGFLKICEFFNITPIQFFDPSTANTLTDDTEILTYFHQLSSRQSEYMVSFLRDLTDKVKE